MREDAVERALERAAKAAGGKCWKMEPGARRDKPDRLVMLPGGVVRLVECKKPRKVPRASQEVEHAELRALGLDVRVVDNVLDARRAGSL